MKKQSLREAVAVAIRNEGGHYDDKPWHLLTREQRIGWLGDADRAIEAYEQWHAQNPVHSQPSGNTGELGPASVIKDCLTTAEESK